MNYSKVKGPVIKDDQWAEAKFKSYKSELTQEFARLGAKTGGAQFSSFKRDDLACEEGAVYCVKISGSPTERQRSYLKSLSPQ